MGTLFDCRHPDEYRIDVRVRKKICACARVPRGVAECGRLGDGEERVGGREGGWKWKEVVTQAAAPLRAMKLSGDPATKRNEPAMKRATGNEKSLKMKLSGDPAMKRALSESALVCVVWGWFFGVPPTPPKGLQHHRHPTPALRVVCPQFCLKPLLKISYNPRKALRQPPRPPSETRERVSGNRGRLALRARTAGAQMRGNGCGDLETVRDANGGVTGGRYIA